MTGENAANESESRPNRDGQRGERIIPNQRRNEVLHVSTRSITLAGFILAFLGLLINYPDDLTEVASPSASLLCTFILFIAVSEYLRGAATVDEFRKGFYGYAISSLLLIMVSIYTYFTIFPGVLGKNLISLSIGIASLIFVCLKLHHLKSTWQTTR